MYPFIHIGTTEIPTYFALITIGFLIGMGIVLIRSKTYPINKLQIVLSFLFIAIGLIIGAKLVYMLSLVPTFIQDWALVKQYPLETLLYSLSGFVFYGGLLGGLLALKLFCFQFDKSFWELLILYIPIVPLVHAIGRIGCFMAGCCYGIEYHGLFAIDYPDNVYIESANLVTRFPVQLLESVLNFILFIFLMFYTKKERSKGSALGIYLICYAIIRFCLEFLRGDEYRGIAFGLSTSQWISILLLLVGIYFMKKKR